MTEKDTYKANFEDFPVGSTFRRVLQENDGVIPLPSDDRIAEFLLLVNAEHAKLLTPDLDRNAHALMRRIESRLGLPEIPVYIMSGEKLSEHAACLLRDVACIFIAESKINSPLEKLEAVLLHEIRHGFQNTNLESMVSNAVILLEGLTLHSLWSDHLHEICSSLYSAATVVHNVIRMEMELDADKYAIRHSSAPEARLDVLSDHFHAKHPSSGEDTQPFSALSVLRDLMSFNPARREHPPTSIRYALAAREVALETQRRQL